MSEQDLVYRLRERARIRRQIPTRKSVQEGKPDRIADLLEEAADEIESLKIDLEVYAARYATNTPALKAHCIIFGTMSMCGEGFK